MFPDIEVLIGNIGDCYATLNSAQNLILSNSSFSYFPVKTGNSNAFVIAPMYWARPFNHLERWASPANLYSSWNWMNREGKIFSSAECQLKYQDTIAMYRSQFNVRTIASQVVKSGYGHYVPQKYRTLAKKALSVFFPRKFG